MEDEIDYKTCYETAMIGFKMQMQEIERLNKQIEEYQKALDEKTGEKIYLENIIKEDKKIGNLIYYNKKDFDNLDEFVEITTRDVFDKINEIIDYINDKGE